MAAEAWPDVRDADELHDALLTLITLPPVRRMAALLRRTARPRAAPRVLERDERSLLGRHRDALASGATTRCATVRGWLESLGPDRPRHRWPRRWRCRSMRSNRRWRSSKPKARSCAAVSSRAAEGETEWCNRRLLARIHRLTLGRLRREIEPVTAAQFQRFLYRWQHLAPGTQLHGADGALQIIRQLQGYEIPAAAWESEVLPRRVARYEPGVSGPAVPVGRSDVGAPLAASGFAKTTEAAHACAPRASRRSRSSCAKMPTWLTGPQSLTPDPSRLSHPAREVLAAFETARRFVLRAIWRAPPAGWPAKWKTRSGNWWPRAWSPPMASRICARWSIPSAAAAKGAGSLARPRHAAGRWALLRTRHDAATQMTPCRHAFADQLLQRWGVVFRDLLAREALAPPWRDLLPVLRRMEAHGEIRGGRFVAGFIGEQFALPEALDLLRARRRGRSRRHRAPRIANADPLNLAGIILPGPRVSTLTRSVLGPPVRGGRKGMGLDDCARARKLKQMSTLALILGACQSRPRLQQVDDQNVSLASSDWP